MLTLKVVKASDTPPPSIPLITAVISNITDNTHHLDNLLIRVTRLRLILELMHTITMGTDSSRVRITTIRRVLTTLKARYFVSHTHTRTYTYTHVHTDQFAYCQTDVYKAPFTPGF